MKALTQGHSVRVSVWASEIARRKGLAAGSIARIEHLALEHRGGVTLTRKGFDKLAHDLRLSLVDSKGPEEDDALEQIINDADLLDEQLEWGPYAETDGRTRLDSLLTEIPNLAWLRHSDIRTLMEVVPRLPVYPAAAVRTLQRLANPSVTFRDVEQVAGADQVLAGHLIATANSAARGSDRAVTTIQRAVGHIGLDQARRVVMAEAIRPIFRSSRFQALWQHSLRSARVAEAIASLSCGTNAAEAFLAALVHDVGRLAIALLPKDALEAFDRVVKAGCEPMLAELVIFGVDHAEAGEQILKGWAFPPSIITAVRYHHEPERTQSPLASVLFLTEFWMESEEDRMSAVRLRRAEQICGVSMEDLTLGNLQHSEEACALAHN